MANFAITPTETTFSVQVGENTLAAANSATLAQAWAESDTAPGGAGTKSAKEYAQDAEGFKDEAAADAALAQAAANQNTAPDIAAGLAITSGSGSSDRFFTVKYDGPAEFREYRNDGGVAKDFPQRRENLRRRNFGEPTLMVLPPPSFATGRYLIWKQSPAIRVYSDGSKWWNTTVSPWQEVEAWWVPARCRLYIDWERNRFWWDGAVRTIGNLTAVTGGYTLNASLGISTAFTAQYEYRHNHAATVSGTLLSWSNTGSNRTEFLAQDITTDRKQTLAFLPKATTGSDFISWSYGSKTDEGGTFDGRGRQRVVARVTNGGNLDVRVGPSEIHSLAFGDAAKVRVFAPDKFGFSARSFDNGEPLTNSQLMNCTIWPEALTDDELFEVNNPIHVPQFHLLGDSFLNLYKAYDGLRLALEANQDRYYAISQDGIGGTSLQQQAARFITENPRWHNATLIVADGGRDYASTNPSTVAARNSYNNEALHSMLETIPHDRWILLGSAPNTNAGTAARTDFNASESHLANICGSHWVDTLTPIQELSNGSADDINYVTNLDLWPLSLRVSADDFHPNAQGYRAYGQVIADALIARGFNVAPTIAPLQ